MEGTMAQVINFAANFAPRNWAFCQGQLISISQNSALFALIGTFYGGDGRTTFGLPDFRGRVAVGTGSGPGLSNYQLGQRGGVQEVALNISQIPAHNHAAALTGLPVQVNLPLSLEDAEKTEPEAGDLLATTSATDIYAESSSNTVSTPLMGNASGSFTTETTGNGFSHENRQPYLAMNYIICMEGIFPSRS